MFSGSVNLSPANHNVMELLIMIDAARRASAARITAVIPFLVMLGRIVKISLSTDYFEASCQLARSCRG